MAATLEQLDQYGSIDELPFSLDDPNWDVIFPNEIADNCYVFTLENLDIYGSIENVPFSLDDPFWEKYRCDKYGTITANAESYVTVNGYRIYSGAGDIDTSATVDASAYRIRTTAADISTSASVDATGSAIFAGDAAISASADVVVDAVRIRLSSGSIYAYADVSAYAQAIYDGEADIQTSATVSADAIRVRIGAANVNADASVSADGVRVRTSQADITATASISAFGGVLYNGAAQVTATASLTAAANAIYSAYGSISALATLEVDGVRLGDNWSNTTSGTGSYTNTSGGGGTYTTTDPGTGTYTPTPVVFNEWGSTPPAIGEAFQGGYYAGEYTLGGKVYFLILADKSQEIMASGVSGALTGVSNYQLYVDDNDGFYCTNWIAFPSLVQRTANTNSYYYKIRKKNISGMTDWYYPAKNELLTIVNNLLPSKTTNPNFKVGGSQALGTSNPAGYWTSSIRSIYTYPSGNAWYLWASETKAGGGMYSPPVGFNFNEYFFYFRPIRRVAK